MLGKKLHKVLGCRVHVNPIPLNPTPDSAVAWTDRLLWGQQLHGVVSVMKSLPFSDLVRRQTSVFPLLAEADVLLERRDAENVVLMRDERYRAMEGALRLAARSLRLVARANRQLAEDVFAEELPWLTWLPVEDRPEAVRELLNDLLAGVDTGYYLPFLRDLIAWQHTAEVYTDPARVAQLSGPFDRADFVLQEDRRRLRPCGWMLSVRFGTMGLRDDGSVGRCAVRAPERPERAGLSGRADHLCPGARPVHRAHAAGRRRGGSGAARCPGGGGDRPGTVGRLGQSAFGS